MEFIKYQHIERLGTPGVEGIENGRCYIFPKIDGTNSSVWLENGEVQAGSRKRHLDETKDGDNAGFYKWAKEQDNISRLLTNNPKIRLFGEWLVPHTLKTYRENAWRDFYVFDVMYDGNYLPYEEYKELLELHNINYIPPLMIINNPDFEQIIKQLDRNDYLIEDGQGVGEGIVIKNYDFVNKFGRITWAKIVRSDFKEKHNKHMGAPEMEGKDIIEEKIVDDYITVALVEKEFAKICNEVEWTGRCIPRLLSTVFHELVAEESWNFVKKNKMPTINFKRLNQFTIMKIKEIKPELF